jgi:PAS domain S-box-containing protein
MSPAPPPITKPGAISGVASPVPEPRTHEAEALFRTLVEACLDHVIVLDANLRVLAINRTQAGTSPESMIGIPLPEIAEPEEREAVRAVLGRVLRTGEMVRYESRHRREDRSWALFDCVAHRAEMAKDVLGVIVVARNVTRQKQTDEELRQSQERYRVLIDTIPHGIEELSVDGTILFANAAHHRLLGYEDGELIGQSLSAIAPTEEDWSRLKAYLSDLAREQPRPTPWLGRVRRKDGTLLDIQVDWTYRRDGEGSVVGFASIVTDIAAQKLAASRMEENLHLVEAIIESSSDAIYLKDVDGVYRLTNSAGAALVGRSPEQVLGCADRDFFPPEVAATIRADDLRVLEGGEAITTEDRIETPGGPRIMLSAKNPYHDPEGRVVGLVGVSRDITERKKAEMELRQAHERVRAHMEHSPLAVIEWDSAFRIVRWAGAAQRVFGWTVDEVVGRQLDALSMVYGPDRPLVEQVMADMISGARPVNVVRNRNVSKDGSVIHCEWHNSSLHDDSGRLVSILSLVLDVTERREAEDKLRDSEERFRSFMDSAPIIAWIKDAEGRWVYLNQPFERHFGLRLEDWRGKTDYDAWPQEVADVFRANDLAVLKSGRLVEAVEETPTPGRGHSYWLTSKFVLQDAAGQRYVAGVGVDVTERKRAEEALKQAREQLEQRVRERTAELERAKRQLERDIEARKKAEREKARMEAQLRHSQALEAVGRLAGGVAHDFNNLLGAVLACAWAAQLPDAAPEQVRSELNRIQDLCKQGAQVTGQLLAVARRAPATPIVLDLARELDQIRILVERACPRTLAVVFDIGEGLPPISTDRALLTTALLNLCLNARDAMPSGGTLTVRARAKARDGQDWAIVTVTDTGPGIPPDIQDRVFQPFFTTKRKGRGVGLGLPTAFAMAQGAGGLLELESQPGHGATFTLSLPGASKTASGLPKPASTTEEGHGQEGDGSAILVVEDEEDIGRMIVETLARSGCRALRARTGLEALEMVRDRADEVRLILLDLMLPQLSGASVHKVLRATVPQIPVVLVTGREDMATEVDASLPLLRKPFTADELLACVRKFHSCGKAT